MLACLSMRLTTRRLLLGVAMLVVVVASAIGVASPAHAVTATRETPDRTWNTNGTVFDTELSEDGSTLYIGGKFTRVRENPPGVAGRSFAANGVAAIDVATGEATSGWNPNVTGGAATVRALELSADGEKLFIGGNFASVGGQPRQNLAAVAAKDGTVDAFAPTVTASGQTPWVYALLADGSKLYAGGSFSNVDGRQRARLAAFDIVPTGGGALDLAWKPSVSGIHVRELEFDNARTSIFVAGRFTSLTGTDGVSGQRESVARVYTTGTETGNLHPWAIPPGVVGNPQVGHDLTVSPDGTRLYGGFGLGPNFAAAFRLDNGNTGSLVWRFNTVGDVQTVELSTDGTRLFLGGHFGTNRLEQRVCGTRDLSGLVSVNPATGAVYCDWVPQLAPSIDNGNGGWDMTDTEEALWVGGGFREVTGGVLPTTVTQPNIARFDHGATLEPNYAVPQVDLNGLQSGGLDATYFDNINFTGTQLSRTDASVNFDWGSGSPHPSIGSDTFSARWTGQIEAPASGVYTFTTTSDDGVRLFVDGRMVIENWTDHGPTNNSGTITLEAGRRYDVQMDFYENGGGAVAKLQWSYPGQLTQIIPSARLFYPGGTDYSATFTSGTGPTPIVDPDKLTVTDADDTSLSSAKVTLADRPDGTAEQLSADASGTAIAVSYNAQTGVLSFQGPDTKSAFRQVLGTVRYDNSSASPTAGDRRVAFVVNDGSDDSKAATSTVLVADNCTVRGTSSAETLTGTSGDDVICGLGGNDTINALEGNDILKGEGGADNLYGGPGDDELDGGAGADTANFSGSAASVSASLADGTATGEGSDSFSGVENLFGSNQADTLSGSEANNTLNGAGGADSIVGLGGADALKGSGGGDTLDSRDGVEGNDTVDGGAGTDTCLRDATELSIVNCEL